jgi:hypothetical protein
LIGFTTALGALGGLAYLGVRRVVLGSARPRAAVFGLFAASVGGGLFVHDVATVDFGVLRPQWLSVSLFVLLPLAYGLLVSWLCESLAAADKWFQRLPVPALVPLGILALVLPEVMILGTVALLAALTVSSIPILSAIWRSRAVTRIGVVTLAAAIGFGMFSLAWDIASIVTGRVLDAPPTL